MRLIKVTGHASTTAVNCVLLMLAMTVSMLVGFTGAAAAQTNPEGLVYGTGFNGYGQFGDETSQNWRSSPVPSSYGKVTAVEAGRFHSLALKADGTVWASGYNDHGQLGNDSTNSSATPVQVAGLTDVVAISAGYYYSLALKDDGTVWAWGEGYQGQLGDGTYADRDTPVQVTGLTDVSGIAAGDNHSLAVKKDGAVWAWGQGGSAQLGDGSIANRNTPAQVTGLTDASSVSAGSYHSLALKGDGTVWSWGSGSYGALGNGSSSGRRIPEQIDGLTGVSSISAGRVHSLAVKGDGTVWAWGRNYYGQLGDGSNADRATPGRVTGLTGVSRVSGGSDHSLAVKTNGTVWGWGQNHYGQLGDADQSNKYSATLLSEISGVQNVASGESFSLFLTSLEDVPPNAPKLVSPDEGSHATYPTFTGTAEIRSTVELYDGGTLVGSYKVPAIGSDAGKWTITVQQRLSEGTHGFTATATDQSGNTSLPSETRNLTIDHTSPTSAFESAPSGSTNNDRPTVTFGGSDNLTESNRLEYSYREDDGKWSPYWYTKTVALGGSNGLADGPHSVSVKARDLAGNVDYFGVTRAFEVDTVGPEVQFTSTPDALTKDDTPTFGFDATDGSTTSPDLVYSYRTSGGEWSEYSSAEEVTLGGSEGLADGSYAFEVKARDRSGNETVTPASFDFRVDTAAPVMTSLTGPPGTSIANDATFSFASEGGATFQCGLDGSAMTRCSSPAELTGLSNGSHTFRVRAVDGAGNVGKVKSYAWSVDTTLPSAQITSNPLLVTNVRDAAFEFTSTRSSSFQCSLDGGELTACQSPRSYFGLANGTHTFRVRAVGVPGNTTPATYTWTVDTLKPTITPLAPKPDSTITDTTPTIKANVKDGTRQLIPGGKVSLFASGTQIPTSKFTYDPRSGSLTYNAPTLSKGKKQVKIVVKDAAGNTSSKVWYFTIR